MADVLVLGDGGEMVDEEEVDVVGGPADYEDGDHHGEHGHNLGQEQIRVCEYDVTHPLLVFPALVESCRRYEDQLEDGLVPSVEVEPHLGVADAHTHRGEDVGGEEEAEIVS